MNRFLQIYLISAFFAVFMAKICPEALDVQFCQNYVGKLGSLVEQINKKLNSDDPEVFSGGLVDFYTMVKCKDEFAQDRFFDKHLDDLKRLIVKRIAQPDTTGPLTIFAASADFINLEHVFNDKDICTIKEILKNPAEFGDFKIFLKHIKNQLQQPLELLDGLKSLFIIAEHPVLQKSGQARDMLLSLTERCANILQDNTTFMSAYKQHFFEILNKIDSLKILNQGETERLQNISQMFSAKASTTDSSAAYQKQVVAFKTEEQVSLINPDPLTTTAATQRPGLRLQNTYSRPRSKKATPAAPSNLAPSNTFSSKPQDLEIKFESKPVVVMSEEVLDNSPVMRKTRIKNATAQSPVALARKRAEANAVIIQAPESSIDKNSVVISVDPNVYAQNSIYNGSLQNGANTSADTAVVLDSSQIAEMHACVTNNLQVSASSNIAVVRK